MKKLLTNPDRCDIIPKHKEADSVSPCPIIIGGSISYETQNAFFYGGQTLFAVFLLFKMEGSCINAKTMQINEEIRDASVRLVGEDGEQLGILSAKDAQKMAIQRGLDLVKIDILLQM